MRRKKVKKNVVWYKKLWESTKSLVNHITCWHCVESLGLVVLGGALAINCLSLHLVAGSLLIYHGLKRLKH